MTFLLALNFILVYSLWAASMAYPAAPAAVGRRAAAGLTFLESPGWHGDPAAALCGSDAVARLPPDANVTTSRSGHDSGRMHRHPDPGTTCRNQVSAFQYGNACRTALLRLRGVCRDRPSAFPLG